MSHTKAYFTSLLDHECLGFITLWEKGEYLRGWLRAEHSRNQDDMPSGTAFPFRKAPLGSKAFIPL